MERDGKGLAALSTRAQLSEYTQVSKATYARWAGLGQGPRFIKLGSRVLYRREDIMRWLDSLTEAS